MDRLYAPWRSKYVRGVEHNKRADILEEECVFCRQIEEQEDQKNLILRRYKYHVIMLNKFPYNAGHLLIVANQHVPTLEQQKKAARTELIELINHACETLKKAFKAEGINVGLNLGKLAGAGLPGHIHIHVLPRWLGDTNFLPTLANTKQVSVSLDEVFEELKPSF